MTITETAPRKVLLKDIIPGTPFQNARGMKGGTDHNLYIKTTGNTSMTAVCIQTGELYDLEPEHTVIPRHDAEVLCVRGPTLLPVK